MNIVAISMNKYNNCHTFGSSKNTTEVIQKLTAENESLKTKGTFVKGFLVGMAAMASVIGTPTGYSAYQDYQNDKHNREKAKELVYQNDKGKYADLCKNEDSVTTTDWTNAADSIREAKTIDLLLKKHLGQDKNTNQEQRVNTTKNVIKEIEDLLESIE